MIKHVALLSIILINAFFVKAQTGTRIENSVLFQNRADHPIEIEATERDDKVFFYAKNRSLYTYTVKVTFKNMVNLRPAVSEKEFTVPHGNIRLMEFYKYNRDKGFHYQYTYKFRVAEPSNSPNLEYPYLVPTRSTYIKPYVSSSSDLVQNSFVCGKTDTIYCMRKGLVMAIPNMFHDLDRLSEQNSLEVRHEDGTIMVYKYIDQVLPEVKYAKYVYPGQPIAINMEQEYVQTALYQYRGEGKFKTLQIKYHLNENQILPFSLDLDEEINNYPEALIIMEMTKGELKKFKKGILFKK